jgi:hypothetical protein
MARRTRSDMMTLLVERFWVLSAQVAVLSRKIRIPATDCAVPNTPSSVSCSNLTNLKTK